MVTAGDFRKGTTFEMEGNIYLVVDFLHVKPGKGSPFVRAKIKNIVTGQVQERTFNIEVSSVEIVLCCMHFIF